MVAVLVLLRKTLLCLPKNSGTLDEFNKSLDKSSGLYLDAPVATVLTAALIEE
jgi:hypothetical protein